MQATQQQKRFETRELGSTGLEITRHGFGAWATGGGCSEFGSGLQEDEGSIAAIRRAPGLGINRIDTAAAHGFGRPEQVVGRATADVAGRSSGFTKALLPEGPGRAVGHRLTRDSGRRTA